MAAGLEQEDVSPALGQFARDDAATRPGSDDDDLEALLRGAHPPTPRYDQSLSIRMASGEWKSISWYALGPGAPGAWKSL